MAMIATMTPQLADLVRPGSPADLAALLRAGGRVIQRGETLHIAELGSEPVTAPWALVSFGASMRRVLVLLVEGQQAQEAPPQRRAVIHHLPTPAHQHTTEWEAR